MEIKILTTTTQYYKTNFVRNLQTFMQASVC
jgi:hypothetical protein